MTIHFWIAFFFILLVFFSQYIIYQNNRTFCRRKISSLLYYIVLVLFLRCCSLFGFFFFYFVFFSFSRNIFLHVNVSPFVSYIFFHFFFLFFCFILAVLFWINGALFPLLYCCWFYSNGAKKKKKMIMYNIRNDYDERVYNVYIPAHHSTYPHNRWSNTVQKQWAFICMQLYTYRVLGHCNRVTKFIHLVSFSSVHHSIQIHYIHQFVLYQSIYLLFADTNI